MSHFLFVISFDGSVECIICAGACIIGKLMRMIAEHMHGERLYKQYSYINVVAKEDERTAAWARHT